MPRPRPRPRARPQEPPKTPSKPDAKPAARAASEVLKAKDTSTPTTNVLFDTTNILAELTPPTGDTRRQSATSFVNRLASSPPPLHPPSSPPIDIIDTQQVEDIEVIGTNVNDIESEISTVAAKKTGTLPPGLPMTEEDPFGFASAETVLEPTAFKKPTFSTAEAAELLSSPRKRRRFQAPHHNGVRNGNGTPAEVSYLNAFSDISSPAGPTSTIQDDSDKEDASTVAAVQVDAIVISSDAPDREVVTPSIDELIRILPPRRHHADSEDPLPLSSTPLSPEGHGGAPSDDEYDAEERAGRRRRRRQRQRAAGRREEEDSAVAAQLAEEKRLEDEARTQQLRDKFKEIDQWQLTEEVVPANTSSLEEESTPSATQGESQG